MSKVCLDLSQMTSAEVLRLPMAEPMFLIILRTLGSRCTVLRIGAGRAGGHLLLPEEHASQNTAGSMESCRGIQNDIF